MDDLIVKFYVNNITKTDLEKLMSELNLGGNDSFELEIIKNDEFDIEKIKEFPDGFLYFPLFIEYYKRSAKITDIDIENTKIILFTLWKKNISVIASCDFEDKLPENGGYKSQNIPW